MEDVITVLDGIYSEYAGRLFSYGMQLCPDKRLVEDALQETFLDLGRHARAFSQARDKRGYLFASFRYKLLRMKKEHPEYSSIDGPDGLDLPQEGTIEETFIGEEQRRLHESRLQEMYSELTPRHREVLFLRFSERMSFKEIADYLSIEPQSAQNLFGRALARLRKIYLEETTEKYHM